MNHQTAPIIWSVLLATAAVIFALIGALSLRRFLGLQRRPAILLGLGTFLAAIGVGIYRAFAVKESLRVSGFANRSAESAAITAGIGALFLVLFAVPLAFKLYRAWIGAYASEAEKLTGTAGVRAWLSPANLVLGLFVAVSANQGFGCPFLATCVWIVLLLLAFPIINTILQTPAPAMAPPAGNETLSAERERVLAMLDAGKISAEESAELLNALGATVQVTQPVRVAFSPQQRIIAIGAALVLVGFLLPWFSINLGHEMNRMTGQMQKMIGENMPGMPGMPGFSAGNSFQLQTPSTYYSGGDVGHGLGWIILLLAGGVALLPFVAREIEAPTRQTVSLVCIGVGSILLLYLLTQNARLLSIGFILTCAGYAVMWVALLKQAPAPAAVTGAVTESI